MFGSNQSTHNIITQEAGELLDNQRNEEGSNVENEFKDRGSMGSGMMTT